MPTYRAILKPDGIPLSEAKDIRTFEFTASQISRDDFHDTARDHLLDQGVMDAWAFRKYWEIAFVNTPPSSALDMKHALGSLTTDDTDAFQAQRTDPTTILEFELLSPVNADWGAVDLVLSNEVYNKYQEWWTDFTDLYPLGKHYRPIVHEMMVQTAAEIAPALSQKVASKPVTHDDIVSIPLRFEKMLFELLRDTANLNL